MEFQLTHSYDSYGNLPSCDKHCGVEKNQHSLFRWLTVANHSEQNTAERDYLSSAVVWPAKRIWSQSRLQLNFIPHRHQATGKMHTACQHIWIMRAVTLHKINSWICMVVMGFGFIKLSVQLGKQNAEFLLILIFLKLFRKTLTLNSGLWTINPDLKM